MIGQVDETDQDDMGCSLFSSWYNAAMPHGDAQAANLCNSLGYFLKMIGDYAGARPYYERALAIREEVLGGQHPDTATSLNNLGSLLYQMGDLAGARPYYERALAIKEAVLGGQHPDTALSLWWMGVILGDEGNRTEAAALLRRALAIYEQALGPEHPTTRSVRRTLATVA